MQQSTLVRSKEWSSQMVPLFVFAPSEQPDSPLGGMEGPMWSVELVRPSHRRDPWASLSFRR